MKLFLRTGTLYLGIGIFVLIALLGLAPTPHSIDRGFERVRYALSVDNTQAAAQGYAQLAEQMPWWPELWEQAGYYALQAGDSENAIIFFQHASAAHALSTNGQIVLGDAYYQTSNFDAAMQAWLAVGQHPDALRRLADSYVVQDDFDAAITTLKALLASSPMPALNTEIGYLLAAHNPESAPPFLLNAAELDIKNAPAADALRFVIQRAIPQHSPAYTLLISGQHLAAQGSWDLAAHAFTRATELQPDYAEAWAYLGEAQQHLTTSDENAGLHMLKQALEIDPTSLAGNTFMALYWQRQADYEQAQTYIQAALRSDQRNPTLYVQLGELLALQGDLSTAQSYYQAAIEINLQDNTYYQALAEFSIRYHVDLRTVALPAARQAVLLSPHDAAALDVLGQVLFRLGDSINAERLLRRSLVENPTYAPAFLHLGVLYFEQGSARLAYDNLNQALQLAPSTSIAIHARRLIDDLAP